MQSPTSSRHRGAAAVLLLLVSVLTATALTAPAQAERHIHHDARRDVQKVSVTSLTDDGYVRAPRHRQGDYVKVKIWHQVRAVRVVGKFRRLDRVGGYMGQIVSIRTPDGEDHSFAVWAGPGEWKGFQDEGDENCIIGHRFNYERDRISMRISRKCLDRPRWVRVGVGLVSAGREALFADDGQMRQVRDELAYSPRLQHA